MRRSSALARLTALVTRYPRSMLGLLALISLALGLQLPQLAADSSPRALVASADPEQQRLEDEALLRFGSVHNTLVVLVSSSDVLRREPLQYAHELSAALAELPQVERLDALTRLPWPKASSDDDSEAGTLEELETELASAEEEPPALREAAEELVAARPDLFPMGLATLAERTGNTRLEALVPGPQVSADDLTRVQQVLRETTQLDGRLISKDRKHLLIAVQFSDALRKHDELVALVERVEGWLAAHPAPPDSRVTVSGLPVVRTSLVRHMHEDRGVLIPATLLASFLVLALSFRWLPAVFLPLLAVGLTALWLLGGMALCSEPLNVLNNILPALVIIIGLNEAVHIIGRYAEESARESDPQRALHKTVQAMAPACLTTTATSAVGLLALLVSRTEMLQRFGLVGAAGLLLAYLVTLLLVPPALRLLPRPPASPQATGERRGLIEALLSRSTSAALRRPWVVLALATASMAAAAFGAERLVVDSSLLDQFSSSDPVYQGVKLIEAEFEGVLPLEVTVTGSAPGRLYDPALLGALQRFARWAAQQPGVLRATEPTEPLLAAWQALTGRPARPDELQSAEQVRALARLLEARDPRLLAALLTASGSHARVRIKLADIGSRKTGQLIERARQRLDRELRGFDDVQSSFGGEAYMGTHGLDLVVQDLSGSLLVAALMIFVLLTALLRDPLLALLAVPANLLPQLWTMGWMALRGMPFNVSSAIIYSLSIGLAVDGSIHLVSRFQEERAHGFLTTNALVRAVRGTGRNIVVSSFALVLGFSAMLLSNFVPVRRFAELITVSMLGSVVATVVLQPVLIRLFLRRRPVAVAAPVRST